VLVVDDEKKVCFTLKEALEDTEAVVYEPAQEKRSAARSFLDRLTGV
jgi:CheY-like chemotaxis protein